MNTILEYPLEALAFNYLSFGFLTVVNNVWAWVAVITAAVSFWRIKTSSTLPLPEPRGDFSGAPSPSPPPPTSVPSCSSSPQVERVAKEPSSTVTTEMYPGVSMNKEEGTKGKLTVYFKQDDGEECDVDGDDGDQDGEDGAVEMWFENWENLLKMRNGEMGWYRCQDMKVIDGNVVRLWDGCRRRRKAETTAFSVGVGSTW
ncbi:uncharacterized protein LOC107806412 [Nicotiana tabacum]|uniref:Uncharacterized protein LOC107806412 n=1 Tax=Nicotiana tabacum TaxID=4097 RepID=A0A1S4BB57_TOBAC